MVANLQSPSANLMFRQRSNGAGWSGLGWGAIAWIVAAVDFLYVIAASAVGFVLYEQLTFEQDADPLRYMGIGLVIAMSFVLIMHSAHAYRPDAILLPRFQIRLICLAILGTVTFLLAVFFFLKLGASFSRGSIAVTTLISLSGLIGLRYAWRDFFPYALAKGVFGRRRILLICRDGFALDAFQQGTSSEGMEIVDVLWVPESGDFSLAHLALLSGASQPQVDEILVVWRDDDIAKLDNHLNYLRRLHFPVSVAFQGSIGNVVVGPSRSLGGVTAFQTQRPPLGLLESISKRLFDIGFSLTCLVALSPMMLLVALAIKLDSAGPVLFRQTRTGYGGRTFRILKFRSMTVLEDGSQVRQATRGDARITRVGAFIRSTSLDELPQFWNVLKGDMSVVGPRPHALAHDDYFDQQIGDYIFRRHVKPGLTGWAQVNRCRGETPNVQRMEERVQLDLWYINNWSLWLDLKIVLRTALQLHDFRSAY
jgi:Undecaprenyl-phosphate glucose phosphotransferase